jgi:2-iminobutanoate/2-iminopropanoate deaminase
MKITRHESDFGGFSDSVVVESPGRWIHVSGQVGLGDDGKVVSGGMYPETLATLDQVGRALGNAGASLSDVVRINAYLTDLDAYPEFSRARSERFGETMPASAAVQVSGLLLGAQVEIDALAFVPSPE